MTISSRHTWSILLLLAITGTGLLLTHEASRIIGRTARSNVADNPGYQHSVRMQVAAARAALDALGIAHGEDAAAYQADYRLQRMQLQADAEGLQRWVAHDTYRRGLTQEIRASMAAFILALDETVKPGTLPKTLPASAPHAALLPALNRCEIALRNYWGSLSEPDSLSQSAAANARNGPALLWVLLGLLLIELAGLGLVIFSEPDKTSQA